MTSNAQTSPQAGGGAARLPELLAPAGTMDAFKAALAAGADAIYCGLGSFNARRNAENMTMEGFAQACEMAHLAGSRVYVTTNILVREDEMAQALRLVHDSAQAGADAFIVQDWGLLRHVHELWPELELHLSTQANVHDVEGVRFARQMGCSRVTLSREMTLEEIEACSHEGVDLEVFAHGALCVCYSGECLLSSMQRGRSANRGLCRQPCRLPYQMLDERGNQVAHVGGTRLLSPRDACTIDDLPALIEAGAGALKIEGRMKAPDYVATVVGAYRRALDAIAAGQDPACWEPSERAQVDRELRRAFNRDFTSAYLHGRSGNEMMSYERGNNRGQLAGELVGMGGRQATLRLDEPVWPGDLLEIRNPQRFDDYITVPAPRQADARELLDVRLPRPMPIGCVVRAIRSEQGMVRAREYAARTWPRKRPVEVSVRARVGEPFSVEVRTLERDAHPLLGQDGLSARAEGFVVEEARTRPVSQEDLREHVGRMGSSPFVPVAWHVEMDEGVGMSFSAVHAVRARALEALAETLLSPWRERAARLIDAPFSMTRSPTRAVRPTRDGRPEQQGAPLICALVSSPAAARAAVEAGAGMVYAMAEDLALGPESSGRRGLAPVGGDWPQGTVVLLGEVSRDPDRELARQVIHEGARVAVGTVGFLSMARQAGAIPEAWGTLPLHNRASFEVMAREGVEVCWLSPELSLLEIRQLAQGAPTGLGIVVSGRARLMTCEHCVLQSMGPCARTCVTCERRAKPLTLRDEFGRTMLVTSDVRGRSRLWATTPLDITPQIPELAHCGVTRFMVDGQLLSPEQVRTQVARARRALDDALAGRTPAARDAHANSGHLFERIG